MLVTVVVLFLVTELPQGLLSVCSGLVAGCFESYYAPLGDTMDIFALVNNAVNFALYCTMSARFRQTFKRIMRPSGSKAVIYRKQSAAGRSSVNDVSVIDVAVTSHTRFSYSHVSLTVADGPLVNGCE